MLYRCPCFESTKVGILFEFSPIRLPVSENVIHLHGQNGRVLPNGQAEGNVPLCNGSTADFGSVSLGSNPGGTTKEIVLFLMPGWWNW